MDDFDRLKKQKDGIEARMHEEDYCYARDRYDAVCKERDRLQAELRDVRRAVVDQCGPESYEDGGGCCVCCDAVHWLDAEKIDHTDTCIYNRCRQALGADGGEG